MTWHSPPIVEHHDDCTADYPEKPEGEAPQHITTIYAEDVAIHQCVDCGAFVVMHLPDPPVKGEK